MIIWQEYMQLRNDNTFPRQHQRSFLDTFLACEYLEHYIATHTLKFSNSNNLPSPFLEKLKTLICTQVRRSLNFIGKINDNHDVELEKVSYILNKSLYEKRG